MNADILLLITAAIWGFAFVAQRLGNTHMGPFTFNAIRFTLGGLALLPLLLRQRKREVKRPELPFRKAILPALLAGLALFAGATLQQVGLLGTTAGKAGFITGLYVIFVPLVALTWGRKTHWGHWLGAILAVVGLYFLSVGKGFTISPYDLIVLVGAFVWAGHVHLIDRYSGRIGPIRLSIIQSLICGCPQRTGCDIYRGDQSSWDYWGHLADTIWWTAFGGPGLYPAGGRPTDGGPFSCRDHP